MMRLVFPLLLLAMPVWAGESSSASGALRVQMGAWPQPGVDTSRCFLKGEPVPCVGHAYDRRVGSVALESQGSVIVDGDLLQSMIREAEQQGGSLKVVQSPCYQKMREAMRKMNTAIVRSGKSDGVGTELALTHRWIAEHWRPVMKECAQ